MGRTTELNSKANRELLKLFKDKNITHCELCGRDNWLSFAHKHKRDWYKGKDEALLYSFDQVLLLCIPCHDSIEYNRQKTDEVFSQLRGNEAGVIRKYSAW